MLKILVVSDSHGNTELLHSVVSKNRSCDLVVHLGDNTADGTEVMKDFPTVAFLTVSGNCDMFSFSGTANTEGTFTAEERRIFYTHGHKYNVNFGIDYLVAQAKMQKADIALYGHTHVNFAEEKSGVLVINPGSISLPRDSSGGTYCVMEIDGSNVKYEIKEVEK